MGLFDKLFGGKNKAGAHTAQADKPLALPFAAEPGMALAPVSGTFEPLETIPDPIIRTGSMGPVVAIWPAGETVYAPVSGTVTAAMPHAFGITTADGAEILVHVGVDTVEMGGDGFTVWAEKGDAISAGDPVVSFDRDKVAAANHPDIVMTIVTNAEDLGGAGVVFADEYQAGQKILSW